MVEKSKIHTRRPEADIKEVLSNGFKIAVRWLDTSPKHSPTEISTRM